MRRFIDNELTVVFYLFVKFSVASPNSLSQSSCTTEMLQNCSSIDSESIHTLSDHWDCSIMKDCLKQNNCSNAPEATHVTLNTTEGEIISSTNRTVEYMNISIQFQDDVHKDHHAYKLWLYEENGQCWKLIPPEENPPNPIVLPFLPWGHQYKVAHYNYEDKLCVALERIDSKFLNLNSVNSSRILEFSMTWKDNHSQSKDSNKLEYHLFNSSICKINCDGSTNACDVNHKINGFIPWLKVNESFSTRIEVFSPGFYCMRIGQEGCWRHTTTIEVGMHETDDTIPKILISDGPLLPYLVAFVGITTIVLVCIVFAARENYKTQRRRTIMADNEVLRADDAAESELQINETSNSVLLLYPYHRDYFDVMDALADYFDSFSIKVWNPYFDDGFELNRSKWTMKILKNKETRIILTETQESVAMADAWALERNKSSDEPAEMYSENYLKEVLDTIYHDISLMHNYERLFIIRFDNQSGKLDNLVPNSRYSLPENLPQLVRRLLHDWKDHEYTLDEITPQETHLQNAISTFKSNIVASSMRNVLLI